MSKSKRRQPTPRAHNSPAVDIVLPVYGQPEFLHACLESLYAHDAGLPYTVTLVDDVSPVDMDWVYRWATERGAMLIRHPKNKGFAATCNSGARRGRAPWLLLLNTDTLITHDGWLARLVTTGENPQVGVVGCLLTYFPAEHPLYKESPLRPPGKVQHAGVAFDIVGRPYHIFAGWPPDHPKVRQRREMSCVTGACLLTRRALWKRLGGLDEAYTRGNFEDVQYCILARLAGYKVVFTPDVHLYHYAGGSDNSETARRNAQIFQMKVGSLVEYDEWRFW